MAIASYIRRSRYTDRNNAPKAVATLGQSSRLAVFRLLIDALDIGQFAKGIGDTLGVRQNTMSAKLAILGRAGPILRTREGRFIGTVLRQWFRAG